LSPTDEMNSVIIDISSVEVHFEDEMTKIKTSGKKSIKTNSQEKGKTQEKSEEEKDLHVKMLDSTQNTSSPRRSSSGKLSVSDNRSNVKKGNLVVSFAENTVVKNKDLTYKGNLKKTKNVASVPTLPSRRMSIFKKIRLGSSDMSFESKNSEKNNLPEVVSSILKKKSRSELMKLSVTNFSIGKVQTPSNTAVTDLCASEVRRIEKNEQEWHLSQLQCYQKDFTLKKFNSLSESERWIVELEAKGLIEPQIWKQSSGLFNQSVENWYKAFYNQSKIPLEDIKHKREALIQITGRAFQEFISGQTSKKTFRNFFNSHYRQNESIELRTPSLATVSTEAEDLGQEGRSKWSVLCDLCLRCIATVLGFRTERQSAHRAWKEMYPVDYEIKRRQNMRM